MATEVIMPKLDVIMTDGTLVQWLKQPGDPVRKGEPLFVVETGKAAIEVEAPASGSLARVQATAGTKLPVGAILAYIDSADEVQSIQVAPTPSEASPGHAIPATPMARRMARELGIDLSLVTGSGPGGRIVGNDIEAFVESQRTKSGSAPAASGQPAERAGSSPQPAVQLPSQPDQQIAPAGALVVPTAARRITAERMTESFRSAPHFYLDIEVDMGAAAQLRRSLQHDVFGADERKAGVTYTDIIIRAAALALRAHPDINARYSNGKIERLADINVGLAVDTPDGLLVPVLPAADTLSLIAISDLRRSLVDKARGRKLTPAEMRGGTFTVSNLGMFGIDAFSAIVNPPEAAILAVGRIAERAVVRGGQVVPREIVWMTLSIDHRAADGALAARFLAALRGLLEKPLALLV